MNVSFIKYYATSFLLLLYGNFFLLIKSKTSYKASILQINNKYFNIKHDIVNNILRFIQINIFVCRINMKVMMNLNILNNLITTNFKLVF